MIEQPFKKPPPSGDHDPPPQRKRYWWRFTLASVVIVAVTAAATSASILLYIGSIANALSHNNKLQNKVERFLAQTHGGEPENILIVGSDKRASEPEDPGRSDTTLLLRLDPDTQRDRADVDPARPQGRNPRLRHRKSSTPPTPTADRS